MIAADDQVARTVGRIVDERINDLAVNDVADQIDCIGVVPAAKTKQPLGLAAARMGLGEEDRAEVMKAGVSGRAGAIRAHGTGLAEDAAASKVVRSVGLDVHLVDAPFTHWLVERRLVKVWCPQTRWARLRRA